jgi:hypothetical protein
MLRAGLEPATCRSGVDNGNVAGPQQGMDVAVVGCDRVRTRTAAWADGPASPDNRAAPARDSGKPARIRTRSREVGARDARRYTTGL